MGSCVPLQVIQHASSEQVCRCRNYMSVACVHMQASDVYSIGALLWSMCSGQLPWLGLSREEVLTQLVVERRTLEFREGWPPVLAVSKQGMTVVSCIPTLRSTSIACKLQLCRRSCPDTRYRMMLPY